jgi:hypothetical protein
MPTTRSALKREGNRRLRADRGRGRNFFKLTLCMVESYPTIYGSMGSVCRSGGCANRLLRRAECRRFRQRPPLRNPKHWYWSLRPEPGPGCRAPPRKRGGGLRDPGLAREASPLRPSQIPGKKASGPPAPGRPHRYPPGCGKARSGLGWRSGRPSARCWPHPVEDCRQGELRRHRPPARIQQPQAWRGSRASA